MSDYYDVFIAHASDDKRFVTPLAESLREAGLDVWYDDFVLRVGDSLTRRINEGLSNARCGIVVLSSKFFEKEWPQSELNGLTALQNADGRKRILPIWHGVSREQVLRYSPILCDTFALTSEEPPSLIATKVQEVLAIAGKPIRGGLAGYLHRFVQLAESSEGTERIQAFVRLTSYSTEHLRSPMTQKFYKRMEELVRDRQIVIEYYLLLGEGVSIEDLAPYIESLGRFASRISFLYESDNRATNELTGSNAVVFHGQGIGFSHNRDESSVFSGAVEWTDGASIAKMQERLAAIDLVSTECFSSTDRASVKKPVSGDGGQHENET